MAPMYENELLMVVSGLLSSVPSMLFGIAAYVLTALAIYTIARRRGLRNPWLAWVPVANVWLLGSLSDQYQYVVRGENKSKRKWLLGLSILRCALTMAVVVLGMGMVFTVLTGYYSYESELVASIWGQVIALAGLSLPLAGVSIAYAVISFMALYDVYKSLDPANCVLFLVLSVLFGITKPFFLFFNRNKDGGMPPRRQESVYSQPVQIPQTEPWENPKETDYL